jgi:Ca2+-binding EF-hand superfamily protein
VQYREFSRKLERHGLKRLSAEEMLVIQIVKTLRDMRMDKSELFRVINKDGEGLMTRQDMKDALMALKGVIKESDIERFVDYFYKAEKGGIDLRTFIRIFEKYEQQLDLEEGVVRASRRRQRGRVSEEVLQLKKDCFDEIKFALQKNGVTLRQLFAKMDLDRSEQLDFTEFSRVIRQMGVKVEEHQLR